MDDEINPYAPRTLKVRDPLKDALLLRDLEAINLQTRKVLGAMPHNGIPVQSKRKPLQNLQSTPTPAAPPEEEPPMPKLSTPVAAVASVVLAACATTGVATPTPNSSQESAAVPMARYTYPDPPVVTSGELVPGGDSAGKPSSHKAVEWPLRFKEHNFEPRCFDTLECHVRYDDFDFNFDKPTRSSASYGDDYLKDWSGSYGGVRNFPRPAQVKWRSKDGTSHEAEIDIATIFRDELVRHYVPREEVAEVPNGKIVVDPSILLEVNDRTIRVYMKAYVPTRHLQIPGNSYSTARRDLVMVKEFTY